MEMLEMTKRALGGCLVVLLVAALAAPADAKTKKKVYHLDGTLSSGGTVALDTVVKKKGKHGRWKPKQVANFDFDDIAITCSDGPHRLDLSSGTDNPPFPVQAGAFGFDFTSFPGRVEGTLTSKGKQATGTVDYGPRDLEGLTGCTTGGPVSWSAQKTGTHPTLPRR
jgi:hypothetical protein